ncbi:MAG: tetratricopeptide repeat protein [Bacilli bacterium]
MTKIKQLIPLAERGNYYYRMAKKQYKQNNIKKAVSYMQRAVEKNSKSNDWQSELAFMLTELGDYAASNDVYQMLLPRLVLDEDIYACHFLIANNFAHLGNFYQAKKFVTLYLDDQPEGEFAEDAEDLLFFINEEVGFDLDNEQETLLELQEQSRQLLAEGNIPEAIELLEEMTEAFPEYWPAYNNLALTYFHIGDIQEAFSITEKVLTESTGNIHALCNLMVFYYSLGKKKEADATLETLKTVIPMGLEQTYKLATTLSCVGSHETAHKHFRRLMHQLPEKDATFHYWYSLTSYALGNFEQADYHFQIAKQKGLSNAEQKPWELSTLAKEEGGDDYLALLEIVAATMAGDNQVFALVMQKYETVTKSPLLAAMYACCSDFKKGSDENEDIKALFIFESIVNIFVTICEYDDRTRDVFKKALPVFEQWYEEDNAYSPQGMSSAILYLMSLDTEYECSQKHIAEIVGVSVSTLRKYCKVVKSLMK